MREVVSSVDPNVRKGDCLDIKPYVKLKIIPGNDGSDNHDVVVINGIHRPSDNDDDDNGDHECDDDDVHNDDDDNGDGDFDKNNVNKNNCVVDDYDDNDDDKVSSSP